MARVLSCPVHCLPILSISVRYPHDRSSFGLVFRTLFSGTFSETLTKRPLTCVCLYSLQLRVYRSSPPHILGMFRSCGDLNAKDRICMHRTSDRVSRTLELRPSHASPAEKRVAVLDCFSAARVRLPALFCRTGGEIVVCSLLVSVSVYMYGQHSFLCVAWGVPAVPFVLLK